MYMGWGQFVQEEEQSTKSNLEAICLLGRMEMEWIK